MLISIAMMFLVGMSMGWICKKIHLPSLFGMIVTGIVLGPYVLDVIDASILNISSDLRRIALIIILMRAGLSLDLNDLKKVGRPAVLMCFVPACFEIGGMVLLAPKLLGISILDAAIMGTVIAAVSPAVIVPKMLKLMEEGYGVKKSIPQMILAGASVDDVFVIVMFTAFTGLAQGDQVSAVDFINIPISIAVGALAGFLIGFLSAEYFKKIHIRDTSKVIILVCVSFLLVTFEDEFASVISNIPSPTSGQKIGLFCCIAKSTLCIVPPFASHSYITIAFDIPTISLFLLTNLNLSAFVYTGYSDISIPPVESIRLANDLFSTG